jgi:hypothetical protein
MKPSMLTRGDQQNYFTAQSALLSNVTAVRPE